jgi:chemotaxis protein methyltransferase CheR
MNPLDFAHFVALLKSRAGIELTMEKDYLVKSRLGAIAGTAGFETVEALLEAIRLRPTETLVEAAVDAMTTNETFFFRDQSPFDHLRRILLEPARKQARRIRVWSAACSTGQEPYSIAMLWDELAHHLPGVSLEILATDLSNGCLTKARSGLYTQFEVQRGLPVQKLMKHFEPVGPNWRAKPALGQSITWRRHNLLERPDGLGVFDVVLCRNVLIYFDRPTRSQVLAGIARQLAPGGYLILGASETVLGLSDAFQPAAGSGLYVKGDPAGAVARPASIARG